MSGENGQVCSDQGQPGAGGSFPGGREGTGGFLWAATPAPADSTFRLSAGFRLFLSRELSESSAIFRVWCSSDGNPPPSVWGGRSTVRRQSEAGAEQPPPSREQTLCGEQGQDPQHPRCPGPRQVPTHDPSATLLSASLRPRRPHSAMAFAAAAANSGLKTPKTSN